MAKWFILIWKTQNVDDESYMLFYTANLQPVLELSVIPHFVHAAEFFLKFKD